MADRPHIKAATTTVTVTKSQSDLIALLRRYGCRDFGFDEDPNGKEASVRFRVTTGGRDLPVLMRVNIDAVYRALYPLAPKGHGTQRTKALEQRQQQAQRTKALEQRQQQAQRTKALEQRQQQAQRTAWRLLIDWIDAACSTTAIGLQSVEEVFMAHIVVRDHEHRPMRLIEAFHDMQQRGALPLALPSPGDAR